MVFLTFFTCSFLLYWVETGPSIYAGVLFFLLKEPVFLFSLYNHDFFSVGYTKGYTRILVIELIN